jgi:flagellar hook-associated protein 1 FlgK
VPDPGAGASARRVATALNAHASDSGIHASALTRIELRDPSAEGPISLTLRAGARDALVIDANLTPGNLAGLRDAINARAADIGITASLTPDGARIVLQQAEGETIHLDALGSRDRPPQAISLTVRAVDDRYLPVAGSETTFGTAQAPVSMAGIVRIEAARPFALTRLGQTQTSASDPFADGLLRRETGQAGRTQTIAFGIVEGIDTAEAAPDGSAASSAAASYAITIGALSATVDSAHLAAPTTGAVAAALGLALRTRAPVPLLTTTLDPLPPEGAELRVALGGQTFRIAMRDGVPVVDGPEAGRLAVSLTSDRVLTISASDGEISGQGVQVTGGAVAAFGFDPAGGAIGKIVGRPVGDVAGSFAVQIGAQTHLLAVASDGQATGAPQGLTVTREAGRLVLTLGTGLTGEAVRILPSDGAAALGLVVAEATLRVDAQGMHFEALNNEALQISGSAQSLAAQRLTLSGLPEEDLIVVLTGAGGARQIALRHDTAPPLGLPAMPVPLELRVIDAATRRVEVIDRATGHSIATRTLPDDGVVTAAGYRFEVRGAVATGDRFLLDPNIGATGDGRNIEALIALQARGQTGDAGGFQDIYRALVTEVGARVRSGGMAVASALALRDAAAEIESRMAGVNLDTEAARLLEQQQAYQALSRVLRSAGELLDTLLQSI